MTIYTLLAGASPSVAWNLQRAITITSTPTTDFQVRVALTTGNFDYSKCKSDGSDIRFQATSASNPAASTLTYWNETWNNTGTSVFWVLVPTQSTTTIYIRYGNALTATSLSNITTTMTQGVVRYRYYGGTNFNTLDGGGQCAIPNVNWGSGTVSVCGFGGRADSVSIIWDGFLLPNGSGTYGLHCTSDDGQRLYINNGIVIDNWRDQGPTEVNTTYSWTDNLPKAYRYEWYENGGGAYAASGWTPPGGAKVYPIPTAYQCCPKYGTGYVDTFNMSGTVGAQTEIFSYS
jgi:hypothetical protein